MESPQATTKELIEHLRDQIDEKHLGVNKSSWTRALAGSYASWSKASTLNTQDAIDELKKIESYVPANYACSYTYEGLAARHRYVRALVEKIVHHEADQCRNVKGSTIDAILNPNKKIDNLSPVMTAFIMQKVKPEVLDRLDCRLADIKIFFRESDIQLIPLVAKKPVNVSKGDLVTSTDGKYAKSTDSDGDTIIWDLENGCSIEVPRSPVIWERRRSREEYDPHAVIDGTDEHAIFTDARCYTPINFVKNSGSEGYLMVLFKRPTKESRLCRQAFLKNKGNKEELHQLLNSEAFKKIKGFPADNLKFLIDKELAALASQQAKL